MLWFGKNKSSEEKDAAFDPKAEGGAAAKPRRSRVVRLLVFLAIICLLGYSQQAQVAQLRKESAEISKKITAAKQQNDEYVRLLKSDDEDEYMKRIAIEKLGYAYPNEKRYYIVTDGD